MGIMDIFRMGKVIAGTVKAVRNQRQSARDTQALPMDAFVVQCLADLNAPAAGWSGSARPANPRAKEIAAAKRLPEELQLFYQDCDGFVSESDDFPAPVLPLAELRLGMDFNPSLSELIANYWKEYGNDSDKPDHLAILPPDNLTALATNSAELFIRPSALDSMVPLCTPRDDAFSVVLLTPLGDDLPSGTILEIEGGMATRYDGFKHWLATRASIFGSLANMGKPG
jgi:hypothetical protein